MTKEEKNQPFGLISQLSLEHLGVNIADKEKWWSSVEGVATATINKKQNTVAEAVKKAPMSK